MFLQKLMIIKLCLSILRYKIINQEIKIATITSLDVIMKNGRAYRYIGIDPELLLDLTDEGKHQDDKTMALQALNLLERVIGEKGYADTDILIKTIRDYVEK